MKFVLHLKHWQLFLIMFAIPMVLYIAAFVLMFASVMNASYSELSPFAIFIGCILVICWLISGCILIAWMFNVATGLYKKLPEGMGMKIKRFYFAFFFPMIYLAVILIAGSILTYISVYSPEMLEGSEPPPYALAIIPVFLFVHFTALACMFYQLYFIAKSLKSVELNKEAALSDYVAEFVLIWFSFIGVWFIQPRINKIFASPAI
jgi:hypothetical protein